MCTQTSKVPAIVIFEKRLREKLIDKIMITKYLNDAPENYNNNVKYLESLSLDELRMLRRKWRSM